MKITVNELKNVWQGTVSIYNKKNAEMDGVFDYFMQKQNIPIIQKEIEKLEDLDIETLQKISTKELDLPLQVLKPDMLPRNVPKGAVMLLDPIIEGEIDMSSYESQVDKLIEDVQDNGVSTDEADADPKEA